MNKKMKEKLEKAVLLVGQAHEVVEELQDLKLTDKDNAVLKDVDMKLAGAISGLDYLDNNYNKRV